MMQIVRKISCLTIGAQSEKWTALLKRGQPGWVHFDSNNTTNLTAKRFLTPTGETTEPSIACFPFTICTKSVYMEKVCARPDAQNPASDGRNSTCPLYC